MKTILLVIIIVCLTNSTRAEIKDNWSEINSVSNNFKNTDDSASPKVRRISKPNRFKWDVGIEVGIPGVIYLTSSVSYNNIKFRISQSTTSTDLKLIFDYLFDIDIFNLGPYLNRGYFYLSDNKYDWIGTGLDFNLNSFHVSLGMLGFLNGKYDRMKFELNAFIQLGFSFLLYSK